MGNKDNIEIILHDQRVENDPSVWFRGRSIEFINLGQNFVWIDEVIKLGPFESREFQSSPGKYLKHKFTIRFEPIAQPRAVDPGRTFSGNHLAMVQIVPSQSV